MIYVKLTLKLQWACPHQRYLWSTSCWKNGSNKNKY